MSLTDKQRDFINGNAVRFLKFLNGHGIPATDMNLVIKDQEAEQEAEHYERLSETVGERDLAKAYRDKAKAIREGSE